MIRVSLFSFIFMQFFSLTFAREETGVFSSGTCLHDHGPAPAGLDVSSVISRLNQQSDPLSLSLHQQAQEMAARGEIDFSSIESWISGKVLTWATPGLRPYPFATSQAFNTPFAYVGASSTAFGSTDINGNYSLPVFTAEGRVWADLRSDELWVLDGTIYPDGPKDLPCINILMPHYWGGWVEATVCYSPHMAVETWSAEPGANRVELSIGQPDQLGDEMQEFRIGAANAYFSVTNVQSWVKRAMRSDDWEPPQTIVLPNTYGPCSAAVYAGTSIIVTAAAGEKPSKGYVCPNTSYSTVSAHEYGHVFLESVHPFYSGSRPADADFFAFHEGSADVFSAFTFNTACLGIDFHGPGTGCTRSLNDVDLFPVSGGYSHDRGKPLAQAFWKMYQNIYFQADSLEVARVLFVNSISRTKTFMNPQTEILNDVMKVDCEYFQGAHLQAIASAFKSRNFPANAEVEAMLQRGCSY